MSTFTREFNDRAFSPTSQKPKSRGKMKSSFSVREPYEKCKKIAATGNLPSGSKKK